MADYYTLLARAVAGLPISTPETRRAIYERARAALLGQLRISDPPADEADIERESQSLDAAISRIENDLAAKAATVAAPAPPKPVTASNPVRPPEPARAPPSAEAAEAARPAVNTQLRPRAVAPPAPGSPVVPSRFGNRRLIVAGAILLAVTACVAGFAIYGPNPPFDGPRTKFADPPGIAAADPRPAKIGDRIGRPGKTPGPSPATPPQPAPDSKPVTAGTPAVPPDSQPSIPIAQRAFVVVQVAPDDKNNTATYQGSVIWRLETSNGGAGEPLQTNARADIDFADAKFGATVTFQVNRDAAFPASHLIRVKFIPASGSLLGPVKAIDVPELRDENAPNGIRLEGLARAILDNNFIVALGQGESIVPRNLDLVRNRQWLDIPFRLAPGQYGKLVIEKGPGGDRVITDAIAAWSK